MKLKVRIAISIGLFIVIVGTFGFAMPSLMGLLLCFLLAIAVYDFFGRRYRHAAKTFNSAARAVCHQQGAMTKVATAFARAGPLRHPCYEYAQRLLIGQDPIESAARAGVPLQLTTAVAMTTSRRSPTESNAQQSARRFDLNSSLDDTSTLPAYAQIMYVVVTALATCAVLSFMGAFVVPTIEKMLDEFGMDAPMSWLMFGPPTQILLLIVVLLLLGLVPIVGLGSFFGIALPRWFPVSPSVIEDRADIFHGLADAIDAGMTVDQALLLGAKVSLRRGERQALMQAHQLIRQGTMPAVALYGSGWISTAETDWLSGASATRGSQILRTIADGRIRDVQANLRWLMGIFFPLIILLLGCAVLAYSLGFFSSLVQLISSLA